MRKTKLWLVTIATLLCSITVKAAFWTQYEKVINGVRYNIDYAPSSSRTYITLIDYIDKEYVGEFIVPDTIDCSWEGYEDTEGLYRPVNAINWSAFNSCSGITSITIPACVTSIENYVNTFGCSGLRNIIVEEGNTVYDSRDNCNAIILKNTSSLIAGCSTTIIPEGVTSIGEYAFSGCSSLTSISIPEGVTSIEGSAFSGCSDLTSITIPESVTSIGGYAFSGCSSLTAITIPEDVTSIGDGAFSGCSSLASITIPASVDVVGNKVFDDCTSLKKVIIEDGNTTLSLGYNPYSDSYDGGVGLFYDCPLETVYLGRDLSYITGDSYGLSPFCGRNGSSTISITSATIGDSVTSIGRDTFIGCSALTSITIPKGVTYIDEGAFYECYSLSLVINYSDLPLQRGSYDYGCVAYYADRVINVDEVIDGYAFKTVEGVHYLIGYIGNDTELTLPADYQGENYQIGEHVFEGCWSLTSVTIPESVTSIGYEAFYRCSDLTAVHISSLEAWCNIDFGGYDANPLYYAKNLYLNGELVTELIIPDGLTSIGEYAFYDYSKLTSITLPESVTSIEDYAFCGCGSLTAITIPESVTSIGDFAFYDCSGLKTVINYSDLPLQRGSFDYGWVACYADRVINVDEVIDGYAFKTIEDVHYLTGYIGDKTELTLPADYKGENYQIGEHAFYKCSSLTATTIPEGVTSIGGWAFSCCSSLTAITIPESVTSIGSSAFYDCSSLKELTLVKGIRKIESRAFYGCTVLEKVTTYATRPPAAADINIFSDATYENATLYVPQGCIDKYQVMTGWSGFYTIEEMEGGTPNYLTLRQADNGAIGIAVDLDRTYKVCITPSTGWKIHSVTFNGEDVTTQLTEEGTFTTPALQADAVLNIAYEKTDNTTMVANTSASRIKVQGHRGTLRITGTTQGEAISVYTTGGTLAAQESAEENETELTLPTGQVYIVHIDDKVVKIGL